MNILNEALKADFGASLSENFDKGASYYSKIDCIEYLSDDVIAISDRIDPFLTVLWNEDFTAYVGFKLKGFHAWYVERTSEVVEAEFNLLVEALEYHVGKIGDEMFPDDPKRKEVYDQVIEFVKRDQIRIAANDMQELQAA